MANRFAVLALLVAVTACKNSSKSAVSEYSSEPQQQSLTQAQDGLAPVTIERSTFTVEVNKLFENGTPVKYAGAEVINVRKIFAYPLPSDPNAIKLLIWISADAGATLFAMKEGVYVYDPNNKYGNIFDQFNTPLMMSGKFSDKGIEQDFALIDVTVTNGQLWALQAQVGAPLGRLIENKPNRFMAKGSISSRPLSFIPRKFALSGEGRLVVDGVDGTEAPVQVPVDQ